MKPRNAEERRVVQMHYSLNPLSLKQANWMIGQATEETMKEFARTKHKVENINYYVVVTTHKGWQVTRYYQAMTSVSRRTPFHLHYLAEVAQRWMMFDDAGRMHLHCFEKGRVMNSYWCRQPYAIGSELALKSWSCGYSRSGRTMFNMGDQEVYPVRSIAPSMKAKGIGNIVGRYDEIVIYQFRNATEHLAEMLSHYQSFALDKSKVHKMVKASYLPPKYETLVKMGEAGLAQLHLEGDYQTRNYVDKFWKSFLVARRHGLRLKTPIAWRDWFEYVQDLETLGRDIHSPKYLVPADLGVAHGKVLDKLTAIRERLKSEKDRMEAAQFNELYIKNMSKYFGLHFSTENLEIVPLKSVYEFEAEGKAMHHCVFSMGYYKPNHTNSLILSARTKAGARVETIEVSLDKYTIVQSRGVCNKVTEHHDEIISAMKQNMDAIRNIRVVA